MKHWKAYIKQPQKDGTVKQYIATVQGPTEFDAVNAFKSQYGQNCIIGWIRETKLYGLQSISD